MEENKTSGAGTPDNITNQNNQENKPVSRDGNIKKTNRHANRRRNLQKESGTSNATQTKPESKKRKKNNTTRSLNGNENWQNDMKKSIAANKAVHELRLNPLKFTKGNNNKVRITPLGGLGAIGGNITVFETDTSAIIVDVGMSFPEDNMLGVDILIPDFDYIRKIKDKIKGVIVTHAHEDHIGAMPYFYKEFDYPIYATPLCLGLISNKFEEHGLKAKRALFRPVEKRKVYEIGDFEVEWIHVTHSIIDASALAIKTEAGVILHTGDFKIDHTPIDGYPTDIHRIANYAENGILLLMSDSTNSHREGNTKSEKVVGKTFDEIFSKTEGRVIMSTFSSNIHRIAQAIEQGLKYNRKVCVIGRSMERNLFTAMELGYVEFPKEVFIDANELGKYRDNEILVITTGSQGETMSALYRMAINEHKYIKIKPTDKIIISAKAIPGNETSVSNVIDYLLKSGADVAYQDFSEIHVSGHAAQEEQKLMIRLAKPKFFLPIHGEYNHLVRHSQTGIECGVDPKNIYLMSDGDQVEVSSGYMKRVKTVKTGKIYVDNQINKEISDDMVRHRQNLADAGVVIVLSRISKEDKKLIKTRVITYGVVASKEQRSFTKDMEAVLIQLLVNIKDDLLNDERAVESEIRQAIRKHIFRRLKKYPTIVPVIQLI